MGQKKLVAAIHVPKLKRLTIKKDGVTAISNNVVSLKYTLV